MEIQYSILKNHPDYLISSLGEIWDRKKQREVDYFTDANGRKAAYLDGQYNTVDMLVALTFIQSEERDGYILRYKDGDKTNSNADNLYWYEPTEEELMEAEEEYKEGHTKCRNVYVIDREGKLLREYASVYECAEALGLAPITVGGKTRKYVSTREVYIYPEYNTEVIKEIQKKEEERKREMGRKRNEKEETRWEKKGSTRIRRTPVLEINYRMETVGVYESFREITEKYGTDGDTIMNQYHKALITDRKTILTDADRLMDEEKRKKMIKAFGRLSAKYLLLYKDGEPYRMYDDSREMERDKEVGLTIPQIHAMTQNERRTTKGYRLKLSYEKNFDNIVDTLPEVWEER